MAELDSSDSSAPGRPGPRHLALVSLALSSLIAFALGGCGEGKDGIDPDGRTPSTAEARAGVHARLADVQLKEVVAAVAGVPVHDAPMLLERWLRASGPRGVALLARWPRRADASLDLERPPLVATSIDGEVVRMGKSRCGEVAVVFAAASAPAIRLRLDIPATSRTCRAATRNERLDEGEAIGALAEAIASARVPDDSGSLGNGVALREPSL